VCCCYLFLQAEDGIRDRNVTGVQTCALPISIRPKVRIASSKCWTAGSNTLTDPRTAISGPKRNNDISVAPSAHCWDGRGTRSRQIGRASCRERGRDRGIDGALKTDRLEIESI